MLLQASVLSADANRPRPRVRPSDRAAGSEGATRRQLWRSGMRAILAGSLSVQPTRGEGPNATTISRHECLRLSSAVITQWTVKVALFWDISRSPFGELPRIFVWWRWRG